jgi:hypothetical protein
VNSQKQNPIRLFGGARDKIKTNPTPLMPASQGKNAQVYIVS